jgi:hypothetical protein
VGGGDVEEGDLVGAVGVVASGAFDRVARVADRRTDPNICVTRS